MFSHDCFGKSKIIYIFITFAALCRLSPYSQRFCFVLQDIFYDKADSIVGIFRDREQDCSKTLTLDLSKVMVGLPS